MDPLSCKGAGMGVVPLIAWACYRQGVIMGMVVLSSGRERGSVGVVPLSCKCAGMSVVPSVATSGNECGSCEGAGMGVVPDSMVVPSSGSDHGSMGVDPLS